MSPACHADLRKAITLYTRGVTKITKELKEVACGTGSKVDSRPVARLTKGLNESDVEITFEDGAQRGEGSLVSTQILSYDQMQQNTDCVQSHRPKTQINKPIR